MRLGTANILLTRYGAEIHVSFRVCVCFERFISLTSQTKSCGIVLAVHGTDLPIARSIAQTGFANLSSLGKCLRFCLFHFVNLLLF
jgi:hypothetical protein